MCNSFLQQETTALCADRLLKVTAWPASWVLWFVCTTTSAHWGCGRAPGAQTALQNSRQHPAQGSLPAITSTDVRHLYPKRWDPWFTWLSRQISHYTGCCQSQQLLYTEIGFSAKAISSWLLQSGFVLSNITNKAGTTQLKDSRNPQWTPGGWFYFITGWLETELVFVCF